MKSIALLRKGFGSRTACTAAVGVLALSFTFGTFSAAKAQDITYNYSTELVLASGTDALGLNDATLDITAQASSTATYINRFGFPAVVMLNNATYTITGSSIAANNGTFALPQLAFYPTFAGLFTDPGGIAVDPTLPVGGSLVMQVNTNPTALGGSEVVGDTVNVLDFAPATSEDFELTGSNGALYNQTDVVITASTSSPGGTPEPAGLAYAAGLFVCGGLAAIRRRRSR